jgi:hypothetical protein
VDGCDQMRRAGRFLWVDWAQASGRSSFSRRQGCSDRFEGKHQGYQRFGVTHHRTVQWLAGTGWVIVDDIEGTGSHDVRLHWLLADLPYKVSAPFQLEFALGHSPVRWNIVSSVRGNAAIIRAGKQEWPTKNVASEVAGSDTQLLGWESPAYGDLQPAVSLVYQTRSTMPVRFATVVLTEEKCMIRLDGDQLVIVRSEPHGEPELYRVNLATTMSSVLEPALTK